ncbi:MAG: hypothetical protein LC105_11230 [Chitinophagales bacterium]|nr:hypothetical protein [Chitinophagales bacterium]MCZ2394422.1 hypothetical protein [Chitinophagales bacterium]
MRFFTVILSVYLLLISFAPCADASDSFCDKLKLEHAHDQDSNHQHSDVCSPFCACNCCHLSMMANSESTYYMTDKLFIAHIEESYSSQHYFFVSTYYQNIWQPPKI